MEKANSFYHINTTQKNVSVPIDKYNDLQKSLHIFSLIVCCLTFIFGVLGNGVVIWVTGFKMKKTVNTVWFLNLAVADLLFTAFLPMNVIHTALKFHWPFGKFMCKLIGTISFLNMFASVYILVVISVDRCVSVVWPVWAQNHRSVRKASFMSLGVWILALILSTPYFIFRDTRSMDKEMIKCYYNFAILGASTPSVIQLRRQAIYITRFLLVFAVPYTVIVSCYAVIIHRLRRNRTLASQSSRPFKIIAAVITIFFLCWAPYHIMALTELIANVPKYRSETLYYFMKFGFPIATSLAFLNSCLNPLLYVFVGQDFRNKVFKSIMTVFETAFQDEVPRPHSHTKSMDLSQNNERSALNTQV